MGNALGPEGSYYEAKRREEEQKRREKNDAAYPVIISGLYLILGACFDLWHPGWLIFLTVPLHYLEFKSMKARLSHPISVVLIYLILGFFFGLWHPGWIIFLLIPLGGIYGWYH